MSIITRDENIDQAVLMHKYKNLPRGLNQNKEKFDKLFDRAKFKNKNLFQNTVSQLSYLIGKNKPIQLLEPYLMHELNLGKFEAQFFKVSLHEKLGPIKILTCNHSEGS